MKYILSIQMTSEFFRDPLCWGFNWKKLLFYYISIHFSDFGYCLVCIVLEFTDLFFSSINLFYLMLIVIFLWLKSGRCNSYSFYVFSKSCFLKSKACVSCLFFIVVRTLEFLKCVFVFISVTSLRYNKGKKESGFLLNKYRS